MKFPDIPAASDHDTLAEVFDAYLIDLDGVMYLNDRAIEDSVESVRRLKEAGKMIRYITNDPLHTRETFVERLKEIGVESTTEQIISSASATASYLIRSGYEAVDLVGSDGLRTELQRKDLTITRETPEAVIVGADLETSYRDIRRAAQHIHHGAEFIGTNPDKSFPTPEGPAPGVGAILEAVKAVIKKEPTIVGKPNELMFEMALETVPADRETVVIGDNPDTDIAGANRAGLHGLLLNHDGSHQPSGGESSADVSPTLTISSMKELFRGLSDFEKS